MKKLVLLSVLCVATSGVALAQGFLEFRNYSPNFTSLDAAIFVDTVGGTRAPDSTVASLYWGAQGSSLNQLVAAVNSSTSNPITAPLGAVGTGSGWFNGGVVGIAGTSANTTYTFAVKATNTGLSKEGFSNTFNLQVLGSTDPNINLLTGMSQFAISSVVVPEPTTVVLGVMGGLALLLRRRK